MEELWTGFSEKILSCIPEDKTGGSLLDIGCGHGVLVKLARDKGFKSTGIEINKERICYGRKYLNANLKLENLFSFKSKPFDIVINNHFIEHFENPYLVLNKFSELLKQDGVLITGTPNIDGWIRSFLETIRLGEKWYLYGRSEHKILYCPNTITFLLEQNGFKVIEIKVISNHYGGRARLLRPLVWVFEKLGHGDNIIVVAKKASRPPRNK